MDAGFDETRLPPNAYRFDRFDPAAYAAVGAHATWRHLRATAPVHQDVAPNGTPCWSLFGYADCQAILRDPSTFSSASGALLTCVGDPDPAGGQVMALTDPPVHSLLRRPSNRTVGPAAVRARETEVRAGVRSLVRPLIEGGDHDAALVLRGLPMVAAGPLLGVPEEHWEAAVHAATATIAPHDPSFGADDHEETFLRAHTQLFRAIRAALGASRSRQETLVSALRSTPVLDGAAMSERQVKLNLHSALVGGNTATLNVALHLLLHLAEHPGLWQEVIDDPGVIPGLVEEAARWATPAQQLVRRVTTDVELGTARLRAGDWVVAWIASANRDESVFVSPYRFDPRRKPNPHLAFGQGTHFCVGAAAARLVLAALVEELAAHRVRFRLTAPPRHLVSAVVNGIANLPMKFTT